MLSFLRGQRGDDREREPLLPRHNHDTTLPAGLDDKLHTYRILTALSHGYLPSNNQIIAHLRHTVDVLRPVPPGVSTTGRELMRDFREHLEQLIAFFQHKNSADQIQDFLWYITKARLSIDTEDLGETAREIRPGANIATARASLSNVGSLLLTNREFRLFLSDLSTTSRQVFRDAAFSLSAASEQVGQDVAPSEGGKDAVKSPHRSAENPPSSHDFEIDADEVISAVTNGASTVAKDSRASIASVSQEERGTLLARLKKAVVNLRQKPDYNESVSTLSLILRRCIKAYTQALSETAGRLGEDVDHNRETDLALSNFWKFITLFGVPERWREVEDAFKVLLQHAQGDQDFEKRVDRVGNLAQEMLSNPGFYDCPEERLANLRNEFPMRDTSGFWDDFDTFTTKLRLACSSIWQDHDITRIAATAKKIVSVLEKDSSHELTSDCINIFARAFIQTIQYIPIPRLELASPGVDLLLENLILEPGKTMNRTSFFPHRAMFTTQNDIEVRKGRVNTTSRLRTLVRLSLSGISVSAEDVGYWLRYHSGLLRFGGEGMASVELDQRGIDIALDLEIGANRIDELISVRDVHVKIHRFDYKLRKTSISWLGWLLKPLLRPIIRVAIEARISSAINDACASVNRELLFARERLRATRVADPGDMWTFIRAVSARLGSKEEADSYMRVGIDELGRGVFDGVYAPGSLVKVWNEGQGGVDESVRQARQDGWRNEVFDI